jgi:hypothetical protein
MRKIHETIPTVADAVCGRPQNHSGTQYLVGFIHSENMISMFEGGSPERSIGALTMP